MAGQQGHLSCGALAAPTADQLAADRQFRLPGPDGQMQVLADLPGVRQIGICDNTVQYAHWIDVPEIHRILILGTVNIPPFNSAVVVDIRAATIAYMYATCRLSTADQANDANILALAAAEVLAPMIPTTMLATEEIARNVLIDAVVHALRQNVFNNFTECTANDYALAFREAVAEAEGVPAVAAGVMRTNHPNLTAGMPPTFPGLLGDGYQMTAHHAMALLIFWADRPILGYLGLSLLTTTYVAVAKRGQVTQGSLRKIITGIRDDVQANITLNAAAVRTLYTRFLTKIDANNILRVLKRWEGMLPQEALRLRLTLQQTEWAGLTVINIIREALLAFPLFNWGIIAEMFPAEAGYVVEALRQVRDNPYFGFNQDLGNVKSTNYRFIGWVAKELLIRGEGRATLAQYAGWPVTVPNEAYLTRLIVNYLAARAPGAVCTPNAATVGCNMLGAIMAIDDAARAAYVTRWSVAPAADEA